MKAMILAAGFGTRLRPYTNHTPKPLFTIAGRPVLDAIIENLQKIGCEAIIINTHHLHEKIERFITERNYAIAVSTIYEPQILGTGGALKNAAEFWDDRPFMVINADIVADIDLKSIYEAHCRRRPAATLVLCDDPEFNTVIVEQNRWITGFHTKSDFRRRTCENLLTFTGIQVLEPHILDYIPDNTPFSTIDAFKSALADDEKIEAFIVPGGMWQDIGTPERYKRAAIREAMPRAFEQAYGSRPTEKIRCVKLEGDGSQRDWYRLTTRQRSLVMVDHGIRRTCGGTEADSFVQIGRHLHRRSIRVANIHFYDTFSGLVFLEDLGNVNLQQVVRSTHDPNKLVALYKSAIIELIKLSRDGADEFDPDWTYQTSHYDRTLIIEKECRYFLDAFLNGYLGFNIRFEELEAEFILLAQKALRYSTAGFMHRDMQSRNIMIERGGIYFIDYQGGRIGPIQYDLASLLIDPYVELPRNVQTRLLEMCMDLLSVLKTVEREKFRSCFHYCSLTRNLQILGAFAYLSRVKAKRQFEKYIPPAVRTLKSNLANRGPTEFPGLSAVVKRVCERLYQTTEK
jgi:aminoglycoside/choline kinase family phosphotransferase/choline kinase